MRKLFEQIRSEIIRLRRCDVRMDVVLVDLLTHLIAEDLIGLRDMLASLQRLNPPPKQDGYEIEQISPASGEWPCLQYKQESAQEVERWAFAASKQRKEIESLESKLRWAIQQREAELKLREEASKTIDDLQRYTKQREEEVRKRVLRSNEGN